MCQVPVQLKELIKQRLCAAAEEIFALFEKTLTEYEEENERQRALLEQLLRRPSVLHQTAESSATQPSHKEETEETEEFRYDISTPLSCGSVKLEVQLSDTEEVSLKTTEEEKWNQPHEQSEVCPQLKPAVPLSPTGGTQLNQDKALTRCDSDENDQSNESQHNLCWICGKSYKWKTGLTKHMKTHTGEKKFSCSECGKRFFHKTELCSHMFVHRSRNTVKSKTSASGPQEGNATAGQTRGEMGELCRSCSICGKEFPWISLLRQHMVSHSNERPFGCSVCEKSFKSKRGLNDHMLLVHEILIIPENTSTANVPQGGSPKVEQSHGEIPKACSICGKEFRRNTLLKQHMRCHSKEQLLSCSVCGKSCKSKSDLHAHMFVHKNKTSPENTSASKICSICGKGFRLTYLLQGHMKSHSNERPFSCSVCGNKFKKKTGLYSHMFVHKTRTVPENTSASSEAQGSSSTMEETQGKTPIVCVVCGKLFPWRGCLRKHMMTHTGEKPFSCSICGKSFNRNSTLRLHMAIHNRASSSNCSRQVTHESNAKRETEEQTKPKPNPHSDSSAEVK